LTLRLLPTPLFLLFFFNSQPTTDIYTLSLHDALPIYWSRNCIVMANHSSILDITAVLKACPTPLSFMGKVELLNNPVTGFFFKRDRKSTRLNSSHVKISYAVFCLKKKTDRIRV